MGQAGDPEGRRTAGKMTPLLLIPGMMCDARMWGGLPALLHPRPVAHCLPTKAETMADLAALILRDAPDRFALAGLSMGGIVAMEVLRQAPERVERLALLDTNPRAETAQAQARRGMIPGAAAVDIACKATLDHFDQALWARQRAVLGHPLVSVLETWMARLDPESREWLHYGATTADLFNTVLVLQLQEAGALLLARMARQPLLPCSLGF